jgi:hypothetical protein
MKAKTPPSKPPVGEAPKPTAATPKKPETCRLDEQKPVCGCARPELLEPERKKK